MAEIYPSIKVVFSLAGHFFVTGTNKYDQC